MIDYLREPKHRVRFAVGLLIFGVVGWPLTALTIFSDEQQGILGLSWLAVILTAIDILATTDTRQAVEDE